MTIVYRKRRNTISSRHVGNQVWGFGRHVSTTPLNPRLTRNLHSPSASSPSKPGKVAVRAGRIRNKI